MTVLASCLLAALVPFAALVPQDPPAVPGQGGAVDAAARKPLLSPTEQVSLHKKLVDYISADDGWTRATGLKDRDKASRAREKARTEFDAEWAKHEKKGNLLGSMADLRAIFDNCFELKRPAFPPGQLRKEQAKEDDVDYSFYLPKAYRAEKPCTTLVMLPGLAAADTPGVWAKAADYFTATWDKTDALNETLFLVCTVPSGLELDPVPDLSRDADSAEEERRNKAVFGGLRPITATYNVDRARVFLDCGRGACGFGLRFLSVFPDRFTGAILREPIAVDDIRVGSLHGMPILMLKTAATAGAVDALKKRLEEVTPDIVTVIDATDEYPHKAAAPAISAWMAKHRRSMTPPTVIIEPNHDRFNRSYWVDIDRADALLGAPADARPRIEVTADRAANRITVKARAIESFYLFLNDDLLDLDKEFTVVVNDKAVTEKKTRVFEDMWVRMRQRGDWNYLFPVMYKSEVPKPPVEGGDKKQ